MAQFSIDINDEMCDRVWNAFAFRFQYDREKIVEETKQEFTRRKAIEWIKDIVVNAEADQAAIQARQTAQASTSESLVIE